MLDRLAPHAVLINTAHGEMLNVESAVARLLPLREAKPVITDARLFARIVAAAFGQRRKTLRNAVRNLFDEETLKKPIFDKRAEQLSVADFVELGYMMK